MSIYVTGLGAITPWGDFTLLAERSPRLLVNDDVAEIADFDLKRYLATPKTYLDRCSALTLGGCALALEDGGLTGPFGDDFGLAVGTEFGCVETMRAFEAKLHEGGARTVSPLLFSHSYYNSPASLAAIEWGLKGTHATFCGAGAGWDALWCAHDAIALGHAARMLAGAADALSPARQLAGETEWDDGRGAAAPGEAAVFFLVEQFEPEHAPAHGVPWERIQVLAAQPTPAAYSRLGATGPLVALAIALSDGSA